MAYSSALSTALNNRMVRTSSAGSAKLQNQEDPNNPLSYWMGYMNKTSQTWVSNPNSNIGGYNPNYNAATNSYTNSNGITTDRFGNTYNPNGFTYSDWIPVQTNLTGTNNQTNLTGTNINPTSWWTTGNLSTWTSWITPDTNWTQLTDYEKSLGITQADKDARNQNYNDLIAANNAKSAYSSSDYYNQLVQQLWRSQTQSDLEKAQQQQVNLQSWINAQENEVSTGWEGMLSQARQNTARALPMNQILATNIAQQNLDVNKLNNIDNQISLRMQLKSADLQNKVSAIQSNLEALKWKVPDYMIQYANTQLQQKMQQQQAIFQDQLKNGDINSTDPIIRRKAIQNAVADVYNTYQGMPFTSTQQAHVAQIEQMVNSGMSLDDAIKQNLTTPIQNSPSYNQWAIAKGIVKSPYQSATEALNLEKLQQDLETGKIIKGNDSTGASIFYDAKTHQVISLDNYINWNNNWSSNYSVTPWNTSNRPDRNNNPWNLKIAWDNWTDANGFGIFSTPQAWFDAMVKDVSSKINWQSKYSGQIKTLQDLINVYAPAWDWNNPNSYASIVAKSLWVKPNTPVSQLKGKEIQLASAMAKHEWFTGQITAWISPTDNSNNSNTNSSTLDITTPNSNGSQPVSQNPDWSINYADWTNSKQFNNSDIKLASENLQSSDWLTSKLTQTNHFTDSQIGILRWLIAAENQWRFMPKQNGQAAYLLTWEKGDKSIADMVSMLNQYNQSPEFTANEKKTIQNVIDWNQAYSATKDPQWYMLNAIQDAARNAGVQWTPNDYKNANATKLAFSVGKYGQQVAAADTAIDHMNDYKTLLAANWNTNFPWYNEAMNRVKTWMWASWPIQLQVIANTVWDELANAYNINAEWGKEKKASDFVSSLSPSQWIWSVSTQINLMAQRIKNMYNDQWKPIMWTQKNQAIENLLSKAKQYTQTGEWPKANNNTDWNSIFNKYK